MQEIFVGIKKLLLWKVVLNFSLFVCFFFYCPRKPHLPLLKYFNEVSLHILNAHIDFTLTSKRFDKPFLRSNKDKKATLFIRIAHDLIKIICQFENKRQIYEYMFIIIFISISVIFHFPRTENIQQYLVIVIFFICMYNEDYDRKKWGRLDPSLYMPTYFCHIYFI